MGKDYYKILGVARNADEKTIRSAYKKLALKWHPDRNPDNEKVASEKFKEVSEAYEVLSDADKKKIYDQFGEAGLKDGVPPEASGFSGGMPGGASFNGSFHPADAQKIFEQFFGGMSGMSGMGGMGGMSGGDMGIDIESLLRGHGGHRGHGGRSHSGRKKKGRPVEYPISLTLEELFSGRDKNVIISRTVTDQSGTQRVEKSKKKITIKPGWKDGTKITYTEAGDESPWMTAGDVVFIIKEKPHPNFKREGNDLIYKAPISLETALCGGHLSIPSIEGKTLKVALNDVVRPGYRKHLSGYGMPDQKHPTRRGDLIIEFDVTFPSSLTPQQKTKIREAQL
eukprot:TRINITY_DN1681_c0_g2_i1.p1 TRINITY_DN1681_c0_g2~~TRINITY_DN1681_c0_g2_i1.p1  ORF type:complete len:346 (-),score=73.08 TRINITY_DN1681_c0_g2_i1:6-1022(-)